MATKRIVEETSLKLNVTTGVDDYGNDVFANKNISGISPELSDADAFAVGAAVGGLQMYNVNDVYRVDTCRLAAE